jgi:hypothetical protein
MPRSEGAARDAESRGLWESPAFQEIRARSLRSIAERGAASLEDLDKQRPLTAAEAAIADEYLDAFDRLEREQGTEVTGEQSRLLEVVLIAARFARGERTLAEWVEYAGIPEPEIRAASVALRALGLNLTPVHAPVGAG